MTFWGSFLCDFITAFRC